MQPLLLWDSHFYSVTYSECVSVDFIIQHAKHMRLFILWSAQFYQISPRYLKKDKIF
jgi:hypothetical protein